jgi:hypothetical protein
MAKPTLRGKPSWLTEQNKMIKTSNLVGHGQNKK